MDLKYVPYICGKLSSRLGTDTIAQRDGICEKNIGRPR